MTQQKPAKPRKVGPAAKAQAMQKLSEGHQVTAVARELGLDRGTVRVWRDSPEGQRLLNEARKTREAEFAESSDAARRILREAAVLAAQRLVDRMHSATPFEAVSAAEAILARVGLPRSTRTEVTMEPGVDLSKLTDEELAQLDALNAKARG